MSTLLRKPSVGPIVGHTTKTSARLWIRGADVGEQRTIGIGGLMRGTKVLVSSLRYFRLRREFDRTGICDFADLKPDEPYKARLASLTMDTTDPREMRTDEELLALLPKPARWAAELETMDGADCEATFRTFPSAGANAPVSLIFGSCLYPGVWWGQSKKGDEIFQAVAERLVAQPKRLRLFLMVGDQIYADKFHKDFPFGLGKADSPHDYQSRYQDAFNGPYLRAVLRSIPTYMILDDHEIEDNWSADRLSSERLLFNVAISAYMSYQWSHGPRNRDKNLYYDFTCGDYPFFALDGRTQRRRDPGRSIDENHLLGYPARPSAPGYKGQIDELCDWLVAQQGNVGSLPKFVISPTVFVPNDRGSIVRPEDSDSWPGFPGTRRRILATIVEHAVQNVVFLSGDIHCSNVAEMRFLEEAMSLPLRAFSVTSSAFFWPFPFADGDPLSYVHDAEADGDSFRFKAAGKDVVMHYRAWNFEQDDNFTQLDIEPGLLRVTTFDRHGKEHAPPTTVMLGP